MDDPKSAFITGYMKASTDMARRILTTTQRNGGEIVFNRDAYMEDFEEFVNETPKRATEEADKLWIPKD